MPGGNAEVTPGPATRTRSTDVAAASGGASSATAAANATKDPFDIGVKVAPSRTRDDGQAPAGVLLTSDSSHTFPS
jgi:hypothetical protein